MTIVTHTLKAGFLQVLSLGPWHTWGFGKQEPEDLGGKAAEQVHAAERGGIWPANECSEEKGLGIMIADAIGASGPHISKGKWRNWRRSRQGLPRWNKAA